MIFGPFLGLIGFLLYPVLAIIAIALFHRGVLALEGILRVLVRLEDAQQHNDRL